MTSHMFEQIPMIMSRRYSNRQRDVDNNNPLMDHHAAYSDLFTHPARVPQYHNQYQYQGQGQVEGGGKGQDSPSIPGW